VRWLMGPQVVCLKIVDQLSSTGHEENLKEPMGQLVYTRNDYVADMIVGQSEIYRGLRSMEWHLHSIKSNGVTDHVIPSSQTFPSVLNRIANSPKKQDFPNAHSLCRRRLLT
jgi:hypothetical protein